MSSSFSFEDPDHFTAGTTGGPGERVFYLQARQDDKVVSLRLEKQQVAALGEYLGGILADLPDTEPPVAPAELIQPAIAEWVVAALAVAYETTDDRILLVAEEMQVEDEDDPAGHEAEDRATARFRLTRAQTAAFIERAAELMVAGRPPCRLCGRPMDVGGHACPRLN